MKENTADRKADYIGITGSILCILHCMAAPALMVTSSLLREEGVFQASFLGLDYAFIAINIAAVYFATRHTASATIKKALWSFLTLFGLSLLLEDVSPVFEYMAYVASAGLITSHLLNLRLHRALHAHSASKAQSAPILR